MLETVEERIRRSRRTLKGWEWLATVSPDTEEVIGLLGQEVRALGGVAFEHPCHAAVVAQLVSGYIALAGRLKDGQASGHQARN